jgi:hypothetical protein
MVIDAPRSWRVVSVHDGASTADLGRETARSTPPACLLSALHQVPGTRSALLHASEELKGEDRAFDANRQGFPGQVVTLSFTVPHHAGAKAQSQPLR